MAKVTGFNYATIKDPKAAEQAQTSAREIKSILEQSALAVVNIGKLMATVKEGLTPKSFIAWLESEFGWGGSVASNYMQAARVFGDLDCLKQFQPSPICTLARKGIPETVVKEAIKRARAGEMITFSVVNQMLKKAGHKPTNPNAGIIRKPFVPTFPAEGNIGQVREALDSLTSVLGKIIMEPADRQSLASKFLALAMMLQQPIEPTSPPAASAPKKPAASKRRAVATA
jgi:hypothetical protein